MRKGNALQVFYDGKLVGTLAMTADHKAAFQYSEEWIENGFPISPFSLPLKKQVFVPTKDYFDGLFGVFADSLPDNWGRLLLVLLFVPLEYRLRAEKYEIIAYSMQFKIFHLISIVYDCKTNNSIKIRFCGRTIKEISFEEAEEQVEEKLEKTQKVVTKATQEEVEAITKNKRGKQQPKSTGATHTDESKKIQVSSSVEKLESRTQGKREQVRRHEEKHTASKKQNKASNHSRTEINWIETIKFIWEDENRGPFIRFCKALLKDLWRAIRPKGISFNLILGLDDPAETGMWLAKLMVLYPF